MVEPTAPGVASPDDGVKLAGAIDLVDRLRDQLAAVAELYDAEQPGQEIVEARALIEEADEFLLAVRGQVVAGD